MRRLPLILALSAFAAGAADSTYLRTPRTEHWVRMQAAISSRDYDAWKAERDAWGARGIAGQRITRENFGTFVQMHEAAREGRVEEAAALCRQLGLDRDPVWAGRGRGRCGGFGRGNAPGFRPGRGGGAGRGWAD